MANAMDAYDQRLDSPPGGDGMGMGMGMGMGGRGPLGFCNIDGSPAFVDPHAHLAASYPAAASAAMSIGASDDSDLGDMLNGGGQGASLAANNNPIMNPMNQGRVFDTSSSDNSSHQGNQQQQQRVHKAKPPQAAKSRKSGSFREY